MPDDNMYKAIFAKKLRYYMKLNNKNQMDLMNDLHLGSSTVSSWCTGQKLPRIGKIQMLADYFGINKSDLLEEKNDIDVEVSYFLNDCDIEIIQFIRQNPQYYSLVNQIIKIKQDDIDIVKQIIDKFVTD